MKNVKKFLGKIFGGLDMSWARVVIFAVVMGIWTALMAIFAPDGSSFHDIVATVEWWVLPAMIIIVNSKKPLEAALKTFVFFLISQPLVYLIQVPFNDMGWGLFGYYPYWLKITFLTFPGAFLGWFVKKDQWYSGAILSVMTGLLAFLGVGFLQSFLETPPNHLLTVIYCFAMTPVLVFGVFKHKTPRIICTVITACVLGVCVLLGGWAKPYESLNTTIIKDEGISFVGEPSISFWSGEGKGDVEIYKESTDYVIKASGLPKKMYYFDISDEENTYSFRYYFDETKTLVIEQRGE